jgi:hypothetical protein
VYDLTVYAVFGGFYSDPFTVAIIKPSYAVHMLEYPIHSALLSTGYSTVDEWTVYDTCDNPDSGLDGNEAFGSYTDDYYLSTTTYNNWGYPPTAGHGLNPSATWTDTIFAYGYTVPTTQNPQSPLGGQEVLDDSGWSLLVGSQSYGVGIVVHQDDQQWFRDHGVHEP